NGVRSTFPAEALAGTPLASCLAAMTPADLGIAVQTERRSGERRAVHRPVGERPQAARSEPHLWRSGADIIDYALWATDGAMGHVSALCVEEESLAVTEIVAVMRRWFWSERVFVPLGAVRRIDSLERRVEVHMSRAEIRRFSRQRTPAS